MAPTSHVAGLREQERSHVVEHLSAGTRVVVVTGLGGIGKSALAHDVVEALHQEHPEMSSTSISIGVGEGASITERLLDETGGQAEPDTGSAPEPRLVVIHGGEYLTSQVTALEELATGIQGLQLLITSRVPLAVPSAVTVGLRGLDTSARGDAVKLFLALADELAVQIDPDHLPLVRDIVRRLGGYPLAIRLFAAQLEQHSLQTLHESILGRSNEAQVDSAGTLRGVIEWSLDRQSTQAVKLLKVLSTFHGWSTLDSIEGVAAEVELRSATQSRRVTGRTLWLSELIEAGLVNVDEAFTLGDGVRLYRVHDSVNEVVRSYPVENEAPPEVLAQAHHEWFSARLVELVAAFTTRRESLANELLLIELSEYSAAIESLIDADPHTALTHLNQIGEFWGTRGRMRLGARLLRTTLRAIGEDDGGFGATSVSVALAQSWLANMQLRSGAALDATTYQTWLADQLQSVLDGTVEVTADHFVLAMHFVFVAMLSKDYDAAVLVGERSRDLAIEIGDDYQAGMFSFLLSRVTEQAGDASTATRHVERAIVHVRRTENESFLAKCMSQAVLIKQADLSPAELIEALRPLPEIHLKNRSFKDAALLAAPLAIAYFHSGNDAEALALLRRTLSLSHRIHYFDGQLYCVVLIAFAELSEHSTPENVARAARLYGGFRPYMKRFEALIAPGYQKMLHGAIQGLNLMLGQGEFDRITRTAPRAWSDVVREADEFAAELQAALPTAVIEQPRDAASPFADIERSLSPRERALLDLLLTGIPDKQIAERLGLKSTSVRSYNSRIFRKFGIGSRSELLALYRTREP